MPRIAAFISLLALLALAGSSAEAGKKQSRGKKPTCAQLEAAIEAKVAELKPQYGAVNGGPEALCTTVSKYTKQGAATIGRRDPSPTCTLTACCPAADCIHTNWSWDQTLTRNKKGKLVTAISAVRCRRFQVLNGAQGGPQTAC